MPETIENVAIKVSVNGKPRSLNVEPRMLLVEFLREQLDLTGTLHPIQRAFGEAYGLQCGYCTPGLMLSAAQLLARNQQPSEKDIRKAIAGNTCRCTGYQNIFKAIELAAQNMKGV